MLPVVLFAAKPSRSFAVCLLQMLAKRLPPRGGQAKPVNRLAMDAIKAYIQSNLNQKMLIRELALLACMSPPAIFLRYFVKRRA